MKIKEFWSFAYSINNAYRINNAGNKNGTRIYLALHQTIINFSIADKCFDGKTFSNENHIQEIVENILT